MNHNFVLPHREVFEEQVGNAKVILLPDKTKHGALIDFGFRAGGIQEDAASMGRAHFAEHMFLKGCTKYPSFELLSGAIEDIGSEIEAETDFDLTRYYLNVPSGFEDKGIEIVCDMFAAPTFAKKDFNQERNVILEEIDMFEDDATDVCFNLAMKTLYKNHPLGETVTGTKLSVRKMQVEDIKDFVNKYYAQDSLAIAVSGNFNREKVMNSIKENLSLPAKAAEFTIKQTPKLKGYASDRVSANIIQQSAGIATYAPGRNSKEWLTYRLLTCLLGGGRRNRLFAEIREKRGLAYTITAQLYSWQHDSTFFVEWASNPHNTEKIAKLVFEEIAKATEEVSEKELEIFKNMLASQYLRDSDNPETNSANYIRAALWTNTLPDRQRYLQRLYDIGPQDVRRAAETWGRQGWAVAGVGPIGHPGHPIEHDEDTGLEIG